jgi:adenylate cyclase
MRGMLRMRPFVLSVLRGPALRQPSLRQVRLATGLVLFGYVTTHFINHALGNISVAAMEDGLVVQKLIWQTPPGAIILYMAMATHMGLGFWALYGRRNFRWTRYEAIQLVLGLCIPFLLVDHVLGTRVSLSLFGTQKGYAEELLKFWVRSPVSGALQALLLLIVWIHGCLGIHYWLRLKPSYSHVRQVLLSVVVLLPALALLGYYQGGQATLISMNDSVWRAQHLASNRIGTEFESARLATYRNWFFVALVATFVAILAARLVRRRLERRRGLVTLNYPERSLRIPLGLSVLEASLRYNIPHAHVCGGRGRCSTCRIRIVGEHRHLPTASAAEQAVLDRVRAGPGVRLACQLRPDRDVSFVPLLPTQATIANAYKSNQPHSGAERYVVIMFVDMRGSTKLAEQRLPFDTVFLINRFLHAVSNAVVKAGGTPNQILGDGLLALFGLHNRPAEACRQAIEASGRIAANVARLNELLTHELPAPIRFGIGIHAGTTIVGEIGYENYAVFTVIGDPVNVAARLQDLTKPLACEVLMSEEVYAQAGFMPDDLPKREVALPGRTAGLQARSAARASDLAKLLPEGATESAPPD